MKTKKQVKQTVKAVGRPAGYDQQKMITLCEKGQSIAEIAAAVGASTIWTRRVLSTKAPDVYSANLKARHAPDVVHAAQVGNGRRKALVVPGTEGNGKITAAQAVEIIARSVASATFSDAKFIPQAQTRNEMYDSIQKGVKAGIKKAGFGFHG